MSCQNPNRFVVICIDGEPLGITNPLPVTESGPGGNVVVTDIQDGAGDSVMDPVNDAVRVSIVSGAGASDPHRSAATQTTVAAGASATLDSDAITPGLVGHLLQVVVASSIPFKAEVQTVQNGVASGTLLVAFSANRTWDWTAPGRGFVTVAHDAGVGFDGFRVVITNLDTSEPADVYGTFFYDEVAP